MGFQCGIVGLPNVGKSTVFNALTSAAAASANYAFCTIEPNIGRVDVPDARLQEIQRYVPTQRVVPAHIEFVDIAGLVKGASRGEGLGNQFLANIRQTDAIAHVVRCFDSGDITHVDGSVDPLRDISTIETELILADIETIEKAKQRYQKLHKTGDKLVGKILELLCALENHLQALKPARSFDMPTEGADEEKLRDVLRDLHLLTSKRVMYVCNVDEQFAANHDQAPYVDLVKKKAQEEQAPVVVISGKIEAELAELDDETRRAMLADLGMKEPALHQMIQTGYALLGLQTYFTAGEKEIRAWTIKKGARAPEAAGKIHSDFERGFICAEVFTLQDLRQAKSKAKLKELGLIRTEGKNYIVQDGDIMEFRFNV